LPFNALIAALRGIFHLDNAKPRKRPAAIADHGPINITELSEQATQLRRLKRQISYINLLDN
jgi:hypothetical protein